MCDTDIIRSCPDDSDPGKLSWNILILTCKLVGLSKVRELLVGPSAVQAVDKFHPGQT